MLRTPLLGAGRRGLGWLRPSRLSRVVPASESRELTAEVARLREELAASQATNQQQQEELERIRRTLTAPGR